MLRVAGEDEVRRRGQHFKPQRFEFGDKFFAAGDDGLPCALEPFAIFQRSHGAGEGEAVERVGVEAVLDALQRFDEVGVTDGETDAQAGKRATFREGLNH